MAPNKKKKKLASNPARGFATTSTASKPKHDAAKKLESGVQPGIPDAHAISTVTEDGIQRGDSPSREPERVLYELTPEELESQLEVSSLQILVENHGEKTQKFVSRHVSRLQTEKRLLRSQAEHLSIRQWLPPEIMQIIADLLQVQEGSNGYLKADFNNDKAATDLPEDDLLIKLWALKKILPRLGFPEQRTDLALRHLLTATRKSGPQSLSSGKESMWGLEECLAWLALNSEPGDLPRFEGREGQGYNSTDQQRSEIVTNTPATTPSDSRPESPLSKDYHLQRPQNDDNSSLSSASDSDSDAEPEQLVARYLELQARLYEISPELTDNDARRQSRGKGKHPAIDGSTDACRKPRIERLRAKINKIKSDLLFDEDKANSKWADIRIDLAQEAAERKRLGIRNDVEQQEVTPNLRSSTNLAGSNDDDDDSDGMLGGFFSSLPDRVKDAATGLSIMSITSQEGSNVEIRDFGKWTGMSPRRVLEEACKARDSASQVTYKKMSASSFSNRQAVEVRWSRPQDPIIAVSIDKLTYQSDIRSMKVEMVSISCPTEAQAEGYISTVAMFLIFASSLKEEKVHLRLPSTWRDLWKELSQMKKDQDEATDRQVLRELRTMIAENDLAGKELDGKGNAITLKTSTKEPVATDLHPWPKNPSLLSSDDIKALWASKLSTPSYQHMLISRMALPIWNFKNELLDAITDNQVVIICGETGCGKSTQVPAFILEHELSSGRHCKVYCTEPRRISATSLARRVSEELGERKGDVGTFRSLVGFAIRLESSFTSQTKLVYATTGIVMRMLEGSDDLADITHLVLDEVHERSIDSDFLLIVLRKLLKRRPDLKVVLMSATVNAERFSDYLGGAPIMNVPGRTFPVDTKYLEDAVELTSFNMGSGSHGGAEAIEIDDDDMAKVPSQIADLQGYSPKTLGTLAKLDEYRISYGLIVRLLETIASSESYFPYSKAILVFLPGMAEIRRLYDMLTGHRTFTNGWYIYALHSTVATDEQERAFHVPPPGIRKIVLATNIAETGITIPDVTCVIDTGKHKEMRFDERRQLSRLIEAFISRANAKQRRGRAGRVQKGLCFHLFTKNRHDNIMPGEQTPEMLRLSLQDLVLRVKICRLGRIEQTLSEALDPPSSKNIRRAIDSLVDVKALTSAEDLTPLGRQLARLPLDVFLGKLILLGAIFGCLDAMLTIAAILSSKSPFSVPIGTISQADVARQAFRRGESDLLTVYNAYCAWRRVCGGLTAMSEQQFCQRNFMSPQTLSNIEDTKSQLTVSLADAGFITLNEAEKASLNKVRHWSRKRSFVEVPDAYSSNNNNDLVLNSVIAWSFYPKLLRREGKGWKNVANNQTVSLHPTSVNKGIERPPQWLSFYHIMQSSNKFYNAHETSPVESFAIALVCGEAEFKLYSGVIVVDGNRMRFALDEWNTFLALKALRGQIRQIMTQAFRSPPLSQLSCILIIFTTTAIILGNPFLEDVILVDLTVMPTSLLSPFERLLLHKKQPRSVYVRLYHPSFSPAFPATKLLSLLPLSSKLSLRRVSPTTKTWVESADPSVFSKLNLLFPFNTFSAGELLTLHNNSPQCESLTVTVSASASVSKHSDTTPFPPFPRLKHLHLIAPTDGPFQPLLAFRLALQCAHVPLLTHLTITNLSFPGVLALRWGTFTSFGDAGWTGDNVWHGITYLDVKLRGWWEEDEPQERNEHKHHELGTEIQADIEMETETQKTHRRKEDWRTCTRLLHDWLHSFAANAHLSTFKFSWATTTTTTHHSAEGPNPFLLDETVSHDGNTKLWFSAPRTQWPVSLTEIWLGNVVVSMKDVRMMKERMGGLERMVVLPEFLDGRLGGRKVDADDGTVWAELDVQGQGVGEWLDVMARSLWEGPLATARGSYCEVGDRDRASMDLPFVLELSPEDGTLL